jgi:phosphate starvation-inducible membrane PsiE
MINFFLLAQANPNESAAASGLVGSLLALGVIFWVFAVAATIFWLWMLVDVVVSNKETNEKILWFLVIFFLHFLGAIVYFFAGRSTRAGSVSSV